MKRRRGECEVVEKRGRGWGEKGERWRECERGEGVGHGDDTGGRKNWKRILWRRERVEDVATVEIL